MRKTFTHVSLLAIFSISAMTGISQQKSTPQHNCSATESMEALYRQNPEAKKDHQKLETFTKNYVTKLQNERKNDDKNQKAPVDPDYVIPVVFHVYGTTQNGYTVDDALIIEALRRVNRDFHGENTDFQTVDNAFDPIKATLNVEFALAQKDPSGNATTGIVYHGYKEYFGDFDGDPADDPSAVVGLNASIQEDAWDNYKYCNVYIQAILHNDGSTNSSGVAWYPITTMSDLNIARIVYNGAYLAYNTSDEFSSTLTHEFGHWLNLAHTFNNGCNAPGDNVVDTPADDTNGGGCSPRTSCTSMENYENYMDYSSCYKMFTQGQIDRMAAALNHNTRKPLWQYSNLVATGLETLVNTAVPPRADIQVDKLLACVDAPITFTDVSTTVTGNVDTRTWTFPNGSPGTSSSAVATTSFSTPGTYTVTLTVGNTHGTDSKTIDVIVGNGFSVPFVETFDGDFPPTGWLINNPDGIYEWEQRVDAGNPAPSLVMNNADNANLGEIDEITMPAVDLTYYTNATMTFDVAYTKFDNNSPDILTVYVTDKCAPTSGDWTSMYSKSANILETTIIPTDQSNDWVPVAGTNNWRKETVFLNAYSGDPFVQIKFHNTSGYGTRIWIDNINIDGTLATDEIMKDALGLNVFPNPSAGIYNISFNSDVRDDYTIEVRNLIGQVVYAEAKNDFTGEYRSELDLSDASKGIYTLIIKSSKGQEVRKLIKE